MGIESSEWSPESDGLVQRGVMAGVWHDQRAQIGWALNWKE
jgi:hypothetical protein